VRVTCYFKSPALIDWHAEIGSRQASSVVLAFAVWLAHFESF
jgi:hypothetical protein